MSAKRTNEHVSLLYLNNEIIFGNPSNVPLFVPFQRGFVTMQIAEGQVFASNDEVISAFANVLERKKKSNSNQN